MKPGQRTTLHWMVGRQFKVLGTELEGQCISVTPWGNNRIRWVRLVLPPGIERSYAPSHLREIK